MQENLNFDLGTMAGYHGKSLNDSKKRDLGTQNFTRLSSQEVYVNFLDLIGQKEKKETTREIFRRYLSRKIEADTLEEEARTKNVSLNEIEEERNKGGAQRRRKKRKTKVTPPKKNGEKFIDNGA